MAPEPNFLVVFECGRAFESVVGVEIRWCDPVLENIPVLVSADERDARF